MNTSRRRLDPSWLVIDSLETSDGVRCVDLFRRPDQTFGFEEFRRDPEDSGAWTPVHYYSGAIYCSEREAYEAALKTVGWLADAAPRTQS